MPKKKQKQKKPPNVSNFYNTKTKKKKKKMAMELLLTNDLMRFYCTNIAVPSIHVNFPRAIWQGNNSTKILSSEERILLWAVLFLSIAWSNLPSRIDKFTKSILIFGYRKGI